MFGKFLFGLLFLSACQPFVHSRGNLVINEQIGTFVVGKTTADEVTRKCGSPSLYRDAKTWIYIGARSEAEAFKGISMKDRRVIRLSFDDNGVLQHIDDISPKEEVQLKDNEVTNLISDREAAKIAETLKRDDQ